MRQFLLGLCVSASFIAGCVAGASSVGVPRAQAARTENWAYFCFDARTAESAHEKANAAGSRGWELVSGAPGEGGQTIWCFRQVH